MYVTNFTTEVSKHPNYLFPIMLFCQLFKKTIAVEIMCLYVSALHSIGFTFHLGDKLNEDAKDQNSPLLRAVRAGNVKKVEELLTDGVSPNINCGRTPLHYAAYLNDIKIMNLLLGRGAIVNEVDNYGNTALHNAVCDNTKEVIHLLLQHRADVHIRNKYGLTPLDEARNVKIPDPEIINLLEQY